jgi:hypothetical protein
MGGGQVQTSVTDNATVVLRMTIADEQVSYDYSTDDGKSFLPLGQAVKLRFSWWKGARPALFSFTGDAGAPGYADFDWVHVEPMAAAR